MKWYDNLRCETLPPASDDEIARFVASVFASLSDADVRELHEEHRRIVGDGYFDPPFDPARWHLPENPLPKSYLDFLRFSNGGYFEGTHRDFDPLFPTDEVRVYMLGYSIPNWMPGVCPIGFDGGGTFYLLDMRGPPIDEAYPVLFAHAGALFFDDAIKIVDSFEDLVNSAIGPS